MKNYKYIGLLLLSIGAVSCDVNNELDPILEDVSVVAADANGLNFSKYIAVGTSFTAGYSDGALFKASQESSFPNILASKFSAVGGGDFNQPLMADNIGGLLFGGTKIQEPRFYFNGAGPTRLVADPTTDVTVSVAGALNNYGVPGAKSFHYLAPGYGSLQGVPVGLANPYFARLASSPSATVLEDAMAQSPTFFTLSEVGGNDVLSFATSGGSGVDRSPNTAENLNPANYGGNDITNPNVFASVFSGMVGAMTSGGAKGVVATAADITLLPFFTTVPFNPIPMDASTATGVNSAYAAYNGGIQQAFAYLVAYTPMTQEMADAEIAKRTISFTEGANAVVIMDEDLTDLTGINPEYKKTGMTLIPPYKKDDVIEWANLQSLPFKETIFRNSESIYFPSIAQIRSPRLMKSIKLFMEKIEIKIIENMELAEINDKKGIVEKWPTKKIVLLELIIL